MEGRGVYLRVGVLVLGGAILLVALIWFLGGARISHGVALESYFRESVQGLEVGTPVKYRGVTVGRVTDIGLVNAEYGSDQSIELSRQTYRLVFVRYVVDPNRLGRVPNTEEAVKTGLRARLASQGLTGLTYIELDFVDPAQYPPQLVPWQPKADYIPSMPSTLTQVQDAAQQVLAKLNRVDIDKLSTQLTGLLVDLRTELSSGDVHTTLVEAADLLRRTNTTVQAADLPGLVADMKQTSSALRDTVQGEPVQKLLANASLAAERLANASARLPALIASVQATARRTDNGVADIEQGLVPLLRDLQTMTANLRETTDSLRRYPAQVLLEGPPPHSAVPAK